MTTRAPLCMLLGGSLGVLLPSWAHVPVVLYAPLERAFRFATLGAPGGPRVEITFYGVYLCAAICAVLGALVGRAWERARPDDANDSSSLLTAWALTSLAIATTYELWTVWP